METDKDTDASEDSLRSWLAHPHTRHEARGAKELLEQSHQSLLTACLNTTDPRVARCHAEWQQRKAWALALSVELAK